MTDSTYWKATAPDGTDFYTGTADYAGALATGEPLPELSGDGAFPGCGWYHLATVPTGCVGMEWPCRLFEVEPVGQVQRATEHPHKIGCTSVRVLREVQAHRVFGPQGAQVVALIDRAARLTRDEDERLYAAWHAAWYAARGAARDAAWGAARGAARDVACALVARDLIGQHDGWDRMAYDLLTRTWRRAIGPIHPDDEDLT